MKVEGFRHQLLEWFERSKRDLPWRRTSDPYAIWVSEIMLQQTRVATVIPYYERFLKRFPNVAALATAPEEALLSSWAGLGYYSRVRNMQRASRAMPDGSFPRSHDEIRALPGIGDYTAAAVASIAFGQPHAAVDGNVIRVIARLTADAGDIRLPATRKRLQKAAEELLDLSRPGDFNQAMMELGATVCVPTDPQCLICPVASFCGARKTGRQDRLPVNGQRPSTLREARTLVVATCGNSLLLWQRPPESARLAGFWELPEREQLGIEAVPVTGSFRHSITRHVYTFQVISVSFQRRRSFPQCRWIARTALDEMPLSTVTRKALHVCALPVKTL